MRTGEVAGRTDAWLGALEARHLADLRVPEVTRALRALSSAYVERRRAGASGTATVSGALDSAGKRAAFALYYAPIHFLSVLEVVRALGADAPPPRSIIDLGCGTGVAGAAWALAGGGTIPILAFDRHPWAVDEARWTFKQLGLSGQARTGDASRLPRLRPGSAIVAGWVLNELPDHTRRAVETTLLEAAAAGARVLVIEPIARGVTPWWDQTAARVRAAGGRTDEWRFRVTLPPLVQRFDAATGLDHRELTMRTFYLPGA